MKEWRGEYRQIKQKILNSDKEKDILKLLPFTKTSILKNDLIQLQKLEDKREFERSKEHSLIFGEIKILKNENKKFKELLKGYEKTPEYLQNIQEMSENLEQKYTQMKQKQMNLFEDLADQEELLFQDLQFFEEESIPAYLSQKEDTQSIQNEKNSKINFEIESYSKDEFDIENLDFDQENDLLSANLEFEDQIKFKVGKVDDMIEKGKNKLERLDKKIMGLGGKNLGWSEDDQKDFLRLKTKHKDQIGKQAFLNDLKISLGLIDDQKIKDHINKFQVYNQIEEEKKTLLNQCKQLKDMRKQILCDLVQHEEEKEKQKQQQFQKLKELDEQEKLKKKKEIINWKNRKQAIQEVQKETEYQEEEERIRQKMIENEIKKQEQRKRLQEYKEIKEYETQKKKEMEEYKKQVDSRPFSANYERIKQREDEMINKKIELTQKKTNQKIIEQQKMQEILEKNKVKFAYVDSQLTKNTVAIEQHKRQKYDGSQQSKDALTFGGQLIRTSGRAQVSWRQGM